MKTVTFDVQNISCHHCVRTIESEIGELEGVKTVKAEADTKRVMVVFEDPASLEQIELLMAEIDYPVSSTLSLN